jgi:hypothetical protein
MTLEKLGERLEVGSHLLRQQGSIIGHLQQVDIQIPGRTRELAKPGEFLLKLFYCLLGVKTFELRQGRSGPPHGDPKVVEKLGVQIGADTRLVGRDRL